MARYADDYVTGQLVLASIYWSVIGTGIILFEVQADVKLRAAPTALFAHLHSNSGSDVIAQCAGVAHLPSSVSSMKFKIHLKKKKKKLKFE